MPISTKFLIVFLVTVFLVIASIKVSSFLDLSKRQLVKTAPIAANLVTNNISGSSRLIALSETGQPPTLANSTTAPSGMFDDGGKLKCAIAVTTPLAPDIYDKIFVDTTTAPPTPEAFSLDAFMTDQNSTHKFFANKGPYKAGINYNLNPLTHLPFEDLLGEMPLIKSVPNNDEVKTNLYDPTECIKYKTEDGKRKCVQYAEDLDPGDKIDSWNIEGQTFTFSSLGHTTIRIYQNDNQSVLNQNGMVCIKDIDVVQSYLLTVTVAQPLLLGDKVVITGIVEDHTKPVGNASVTLTIGDKFATTTTKNDGRYSYNSDTTKTWGLLVDQSTYNIKAQVKVGSKTVNSSSNFGVNILPPESTGQLNPGNNPRVAIYRYYNSKTKDYWTTSALQNPEPAGNEYTFDQPQGELFVEDDGAGPLTPLFDCQTNVNHFNSTYQPTCPNYKRIGYIYSPDIAPPLKTHPLYLCKNQTSGDERVSLNNNCKNDPKDIDPYALELLLGYALDPLEGAITPSKKEVTVTADLGRQNAVIDRMASALIPPEFVQAIESDVRNADLVLIGVSKPFLSIFGDLGCTASTLTGVPLSFCPQVLTLGRGTNLFRNKVDFLQGSFVYPGAIRNAQPVNPNLLDEAGETGNATISDLADRLGDQAGLYTVNFPPSFDFQTQPTLSQAELNGKTVPEAAFSTLNLRDNPADVPVTVGGKAAGSERTGQLDTNLCTFIKGTYPPGVIPPNLGIEGAKCFELPINQPSNLGQ